MLVFVSMLDKPLKSFQDNGLARQLRAYLETTLHSDVRLDEWDGSKRLPDFLSRRYHCYQGVVARQSCLFAFDQQPENDTPGQITKHILAMQREFSGIVVYTTRSMSSTRRSRLITAGVAFVVLSNQLYIPELAIDLREVFRTSRKRGFEHLSPVAQAIFFYSILHLNRPDLHATQRTPSRLAKILRYSAMSVGRGFDELAEFGLATIDVRGRQKFLTLSEDPHQLIERSRDLLRSPVQSARFAVCRLMIPPMKIAGETALSNLTGFSPPDMPVYAVHGDDWNLVQEKGVQEVKSREQADAKIELWHYRPDALSEHATVDPLSLYAEFWNDANERIAKAAREALEHVAW